jgi:hypothetical protein
MDSLSRSSQYDSANVAPPFNSLSYGLEGQNGHACTYHSKYEENEGPTSGLEPLTCSLRVSLFLTQNPLEIAVLQVLLALLCPPSIRKCPQIPPLLLTTRLG